MKWVELDNISLHKNNLTKWTLLILAYWRDVLYKLDTYILWEERNYLRTDSIQPLGNFRLQTKGDHSSDFNIMFPVLEVL